MILFTIALRNVLSNTKRSLLTLVLGALSTALLVFSSAWMDGSHEQMLKNAVEIYSGYIQITDARFRESPGLEHLIFDVDTLQAEVESMASVRLVSPRFETFVLYSAGDISVGGMLTAIDPQREQHISRLKDSLKSGSYLKNDDGNQLYIGMELARRLQVDVGDELVFVGSAADYSFAADRLIVKGIFQTGLFEFDASSAFMAKDYFDTIMASSNIASHVIVLPEDPGAAAIVAQEIGQKIGPQYQAASWQETRAALLQSMRIDSAFGYITLGIIFTAIFFVVMIYTLLAVYSRLREIGVMRALGTTPTQIFAILFCESALLGFVAVCLGGCIGALFAYYFYVNPMTFSGMEEQFKQYGLAASAIPTSFAPLVILRDMVVMLLLLLLSTLYPIVTVNRFSPVEAIHHV